MLSKRTLAASAVACIMAVILSACGGGNGNGQSGANASPSVGRGHCHVGTFQDREAGQVKVDTCATPKSQAVTVQKAWAQLQAYPGGMALNNAPGVLCEGAAPAASCLPRHGAQLRLVCQQTRNGILGYGALLTRATLVYGSPSDSIADRLDLVNRFTNSGDKALAFVPPEAVSRPSTLPDCNAVTHGQQVRVFVYGYQKPDGTGSLSG